MTAGDISVQYIILETLEFVFRQSPNLHPEPEARSSHKRIDDIEADEGKYYI